MQDLRSCDIPEVLPGLDGLRALSILIVMISHSALAHIVPGVFGVTVFFFVSGFLITTLMLAEHQRSGGIAIRLFYIRRLLRLYPLWSSRSGSRRWSTGLSAHRCSFGAPSARWRIWPITWRSSCLI